MSKTPKRPGRAFSHSHHLDRHPSGAWRLRITLQGTATELGKRIVIPLKTHDRDEALARAEIAKNTLRITGQITWAEELIPPDLSPARTFPELEPTKPQ